MLPTGRSSKVFAVFPSFPITLFLQPVGSWCQPFPPGHEDRIQTSTEIPHQLISLSLLKTQPNPHFFHNAACFFPEPGPGRFLSNQPDDGIGTLVGPYIFLPRFWCLPVFIIELYPEP